MVLWLVTWYFSTVCLVCLISLVCLFVFFFCYLWGEEKGSFFAVGSRWFSVGSVVEGVGWSDHASRLVFAAFSRRKLDTVFVVVAGGVVLFVEFDQRVLSRVSKIVQQTDGFGLKLAQRVSETGEHTLDLIVSEVHQVQKDELTRDLGKISSHILEEAVHVIGVHVE